MRLDSIINVRIYIRFLYEASVSIQMAVKGILSAADWCVAAAKKAEL